MIHQPGIYRITNIKNDKVYIGSARHIPRRLYEHRYLLRRGEHHSVALQRSFDKHGEDAFRFEGVEDVSDPSARLVREQAWIDRYQSADGKHGYNCCAVAGTRRGVPQPQSAKDRMSAAHKGKPKSDEWKAKMSALQKGRPRHTEESKERLRQRAIKQFSNPDARKLASDMALARVTDESRAAMSRRAKAQMTNPDARANLSAKAKDRNADPAYRSRMSAIQTEAWANPAVREKGRQAKLGKKMSPEARENMRQAQLKRWAARKAALHQPEN